MTIKKIKTHGQLPIITNTWIGMSVKDNPKHNTTVLMWCHRWENKSKHPFSFQGEKEMRTFSDELCSHNDQNFEKPTNDPLITVVRVKKIV